MSQAYKVIVGLNYGPDDKRAEPGDVLVDLADHASEEAIAALVAQGAVEAVEPEKKAGKPAKKEG